MLTCQPKLTDHSPLRIIEHEALVLNGPLLFIIIVHEDTRYSNIICAVCLGSVTGCVFLKLVWGEGVDEERDSFYVVRVLWPW